eukprot:136543-Prymnesium_polylepis.2
MGNAGYMIARPSAAIYAEMMGYMTNEYQFDANTTCPEQTFLSDYFAHYRGEDVIGWLVRRAPPPLPALSPSPLDPFPPT